MIELPKKDGRYYIRVETDAPNEYEWVLSDFKLEYEETITYRVDGKIAGEVSRVFPQPIFVCEHAVAKGLNGSPILYASHVQEWKEANDGC